MTDATLAASIARQFGHPPQAFDDTGPVPPVGAIVQYHEAVEAGPGQLEIRPLAAIVVYNALAGERRPGRPLTLAILPPDGPPMNVVGVEVGDRPYPGYWTRLDQDPNARLWTAWYARR